MILAQRPVRKAGEGAFATAGSTGRGRGVACSGGRGFTMATPGWIIPGRTISGRTIPGRTSTAAIAMRGGV